LQGQQKKLTEKVPYMKQAVVYLAQINKQMAYTTPPRKEQIWVKNSTGKYFMIVSPNAWQRSTGKHCVYVQSLETNRFYYVPAEQFALKYEFGC